MWKLLGKEMKILPFHWPILIASQKFPLLFEPVKFELLYLMKRSIGELRFICCTINAGQKNRVQLDKKQTDHQWGCKKSVQSYIDHSQNTDANSTLTIVTSIYDYHGFRIKVFSWNKFFHPMKMLITQF